MHAWGVLFKRRHSQKPHAHREFVMHFSQDYVELWHFCEKSLNSTKKNGILSYMPKYYFEGVLKDVCMQSKTENTAALTKIPCMHIIFIHHFITNWCKKINGIVGIYPVERETPLTMKPRS